MPSSSASSSIRASDRPGYSRILTIPSPRSTTRWGEPSDVEADEEGALAREAGAPPDETTPASRRRSPPRRWRAGARGGSRAGARRGPARSRAAPRLRSPLSFAPGETPRLPMSARTASPPSAAIIPACVSLLLPVADPSAIAAGMAATGPPITGGLVSGPSEIRPGKRRSTASGISGLKISPQWARVVVGAQHDRTLGVRGTKLGEHLRPPALRKHGAQPPAPKRRQVVEGGCAGGCRQSRAEHPVAAQSGGAGDQSGRRRDPKRPPECSVGRLGLDPRLDPELGEARRPTTPPPRARRAMRSGVRSRRARREDAGASLSPGAGRRRRSRLRTRPWRREP